jgi:hypothetical protein
MCVCTCECGCGRQFLSFLGGWLFNYHCCIHQSDVHIIRSPRIFTWRQRRRRRRRKKERRWRRRRSSSISLVSAASCPHKVKPSELNGLWLTLDWGVRTKRFDDLHACNVQNLSKWVVLSFHSFVWGARTDPTLSARTMRKRLNIGHKILVPTWPNMWVTSGVLMHAYQEWTSAFIWVRKF